MTLHLGFWIQEMFPLFLNIVRNVFENLTKAIIQMPASKMKRICREKVFTNYITTKPAQPFFFFLTHNCVITVCLVCLAEAFKPSINNGIILGKLNMWPLITVATVNQFLSLSLITEAKIPQKFFC